MTCLLNRERLCVRVHIHNYVIHFVSDSNNICEYCCHTGALEEIFYAEELKMVPESRKSLVDTDGTSPGTLTGHPRVSVRRFEYFVADRSLGALTVWCTACARPNPCVGVSVWCVSTKQVPSFPNIRSWTSPFINGTLTLIHVRLVRLFGVSRAPVTSRTGKWETVQGCPL